jgi:hypothetical protein
VINYTCKVLVNEVDFLMMPPDVVCMYVCMYVCMVN